jgi:hypothetical protein
MRKNVEGNESRIFKGFGWCIICVFFSIIVPIVINWLYKTSSPYPIFKMTSEAKDVLSFYGSLLGAASTVLALVLTIKFTINNQKEERKLSIKPYLQTHKYQYTKIEEIPNDKMFFLTINKGGITYQESLPKDIKELKNKHLRLKNKRYNKDDEKKSIEIEVDEYFKKNIVMLYEIENCGAGNAIDVEFKICEMQSIKKCCITTSVSKQLILIINGTLLTYGACHMKVCITYSDIASLGRYCQEECFLLDRNDFNRLQIVQNEEDLLTVPEEITSKN